MKEITVDPLSTDFLPKVLQFVEAELTGFDCPARVCNQICIAVEEIFVNIAKYAYEPGMEGQATIRCTVNRDPLQVIVQFEDNGKPYNPLEHVAADTSLSPEEREIGGLGILMVRKSMTSVIYEYKNGANILTIQKNVE